MFCTDVLPVQMKRNNMWCKKCLHNQLLEICSNFEFLVQLDLWFLFVEKLCKFLHYHLVHSLLFLFIDNLNSYIELK